MFLKILRTSQSPTKREMKFFDYFLLDFRLFLTRFSTFVKGDNFVMVANFVRSLSMNCLRFGPRQLGRLNFKPHGLLQQFPLWFW